MTHTPLNFQKDTQFLRNPNLLSSLIDEDLVMMDESQGYYFSVNSIGKDIWQLLEAPISYSDLLTALTNMYDIDEMQCQRDVTPFLTELLKNQLIQVG